MKKDLRLIGLGMLACAITACTSDDDANPGSTTPPNGNSTEQYIVMSGSGESNGAYLQQVDSIASWLLDATGNTNNRIFFSGNNPDFVNYGNKYLIGMNYPSQGGSSSDYITKAWKLSGGTMVQHGSGLALDGDVKARGIFKNYLIGLSDQTGDGHYERVKFIELENFNRAVVDGIIDCDNLDAEPASLMEGETWGVGDLAGYGDYVLMAYCTKHIEPDDQSTRAKATYSTDLANNLYIGVYEFDPEDSQKEYLKYQHTIVRKSADHPGQEAGQIKGNNRSRTETGIEVVGDDIYLFCQSTIKNSDETAPQMPSAVLRISGSNIDNGMPVGIDSDYYVNLTEKTGHYLWRCYYIGDNKFCLQLFSEPGNSGVAEGSHKKFGIFDVETMEYNEVSGLPSPSEIQDIALPVAIDESRNTITFEMQLADGSRAALYTIDKDGNAVRGMEVNTESILGVSLLKEDQ